MTELIEQVKLLYDIELTDEIKLGNSANIIYEIRIQNHPAILRISKYSEQKELHINFELAWMNDLACHMQQIAGPIPSQNGRLYEVIHTDHDCWIACVFRRAPGNIVDPANPLEWNETLFYKLGELMGSLHTYTIPYVSRIGIDPQLDWHHNYMFWPENNQWIDPDILPIWNQILTEMDQLCQTQADYGIVHTDIHYLNFHIENGEIVLFDFDDCEYNWYAYDLTSTIFFATSTADYHDPESGKAMLKNFCEPFFRGYQQYASIPLHWLRMIPLFLRYRRVAQYKYFTNLFRGQPNPHDEYLAWVKHDIMNDFAYLHYDFSHLL